MKYIQAVKNSTSIIKKKAYLSLFQSLATI